MMCVENEVKERVDENNPIKNLDIPYVGSVEFDRGAIRKREFKIIYNPKSEGNLDKRYILRIDAFNYQELISTDTPLSYAIEKVRHLHQNPHQSDF